jgi:cell division protein FtsN
MGTGKIRQFTLRLGLFLVLAVGLSACETGSFPTFGKDAGATGNTPDNRSIKLVERDVESPDVFQVTDRALWDGRPSLGGVWVASADSKQPERVIIRNETNGKFVIGALFRRERENPGPPLQLSSDAASALGIQAGTPTLIDVTALRREAVQEEPEPKPEPAPKAEAEPENTGPKPTPKPAKNKPVKKPVSAKPLPGAGVKPVSTSSLENMILKSVEEAEAAAKPAATAGQTAKPATKPAAAKKSGGSKPFIQIGFFSVEDNAKATMAKLTRNGVPSRIVASETKGKKFWRVVAGPTGSATERRQLLKMVNDLGFSDAYFVTN